MSLIYAIEYEYDIKGRRARQTVWNDREDTWPQYDAIYKYDNRDRLVEERYLKYNATTERMDVYRAREYTYDMFGNLATKKIIEDDDWIEYALTYSRGGHITDWDNTVSSGTVNSNLQPTYDANGNMTQLPALSVIAGGPDQFDLLQMDFTYDRKNRLATYDINQGDVRTLKWDALGRIREKTWTADETNYKQVFYHDGRTLMQIWDETVDGEDVTRTIAYDLYLGETGYLKDIDFNSEPDEEGYLVKDAQGSIRAIVNVTYSGGTYTVTTERYNTDGYGAWLDFDAAHANGTHYMRYISCRVEDFCDSGSTNDNQALYHTDHRHYLPFLGIFLQREPLLVWPSERSLGLSNNPAKLSPYRYAANAPISHSDPTGLHASFWGHDCTICPAGVYCRWHNADTLQDCIEYKTECDKDCIGEDDVRLCLRLCQRHFDICKGRVGHIHDPEHLPPQPWWPPLLPKKPTDPVGPQPMTVGSAKSCCGTGSTAGGRSNHGSNTCDSLESNNLNSLIISQTGIDTLGYKDSQAWYTMCVTMAAAWFEYCVLVIRLNVWACRVFERLKRNACLGRSPYCQCKWPCVCSRNKGRWWDPPPGNKGGGNGKPGGGGNGQPEPEPLSIITQRYIVF